MITDTDLLIELTNDPAGLGYTGIGAKAITERINAKGSAIVELSIPSLDSTSLLKDVFLKQIGTTLEAANMKRLLVSGTDLGDAVSFKLELTANIDMSDPTNRGLVQSITALDDVSTIATPLTRTTRDKMLALGEDLQSRAYEIAGEKITEEQVRRVI